MMVRNSILLVTCDDETRIRRTLESIKRIRGVHEAIVVDNGSRDKTFEIVEEFAAQDNRILTEYLTRRSDHECLEKGLMRCRGDFVARAFSGDIFSPARLELLTTRLEQNGSLVAVGSSLECFSPYVRETWMELVPEQHEQIVLCMLAGFGIFERTVCFRRQAAIACGGYRDAPKAEDFDLLLRLAIRGRLENIIHTALVQRRAPTFDESSGRGGQVRKECVLQAVARFLEKVDDASLKKFLKISGDSKGGAPAEQRWLSRIAESNACRGIQRLRIKKGEEWFDHVRSRVSLSSWKAYESKVYDNLARLERRRIKAGSCLWKSFLLKPSWSGFERTISGFVFGGGEEKFGMPSLPVDELPVSRSKSESAADSRIRYGLTTVPARDRWVWLRSRPFGSLVFTKVLTGINFLPLNKFASGLHSESAAVIANGPSALRGEFGLGIDQSSIVCRVNCFITEGFEASLGRRTDIWVTPFFTGGSRTIIDRIKDSQRIFVPRGFTHFNSVARIKPFRKALRAKKVSCFPLGYHRALCQRLGGYQPSSGLAAVLMVLLLGYKNILITGLDFYQEHVQTYYFSGQKLGYLGHSTDREVKLLSDELGRANAVVQCCEPLYSMLAGLGCNAQLTRIGGYE